jgi:K(+)-stimulated pyrophosphate-energized sodium pump
MLAVEIAIKMDPAATRLGAAVFLALGLFFVWKSFYGMRIPVKEGHAETSQHAKHAAHAR